MKPFVAERGRSEHSEAFKAQVYQCRPLLRRTQVYFRNWNNRMESGANSFTCHTFLLAFLPAAQRGGQAAASNFHWACLTIGCQCNLHPLMWLGCFSPPPPPSPQIAAALCRKIKLSKNARQFSQNTTIAAMERQETGKMLDPLKDVWFAWFYFSWIAEFWCGKKPQKTQFMQ